MEQPVFVYDGDCAFCTRCAMAYLRLARATAATVIPWQQADLALLGLTEQQCESAVQWAEPGREPLTGPEAIARLLRATSGGFGVWKIAGFILGLPLVRHLAWPVYRWVARNRHRMPGGSSACAVPRA